MKKLCYAATALMAAAALAGCAGGVKVDMGYEVREGVYTGTEIVAESGDAELTKFVMTVTAAPFTEEEFALSGDVEIAHFLIKNETSEVLYIVSAEVEFGGEAYIVRVDDTGNSCTVRGRDHESGFHQIKLMGAKGEDSFSLTLQFPGPENAERGWDGHWENALGVTLGGKLGNEQVSYSMQLQYMQTEGDVS